MEVLKNFSGINPSVLIKKGKNQRTINVDKTVMAEAAFAEDFPKQFGVYDLSAFLSNISILENPDIAFGENQATISVGKFSVDYTYCSPNHIQTPGDKTLEVDNPDVEFDLELVPMKTLMKLASVNALPNVTVVGKSGELSVRTHEKASDTSNLAILDLGKYEGVDFTASFKVDNLIMIPDNYHVKVNLEGFALFENKDGTLKYFIALDK
jgi:hypothetical protein